MMISRSRTGLVGGRHASLTLRWRWAVPEWRWPLVWSASAPFSACNPTLSSGTTRYLGHTNTDTISVRIDGLRTQKRPFQRLFDHHNGCRPSGCISWLMVLLTRDKKYTTRLRSAHHRKCGKNYSYSTVSSVV